MKTRDIFKDILFGVSIGDALGVPVEFKDRETIALSPITDMIGYGTYYLPPGTFSDDSSLTFCLAEALTEEFSYQNLGEKFVAWLTVGYWTADGTVFDVGISTRQAIRRLESGIRPDLAGGFEEENNGNGSLMRILPLLTYIIDKPIHERYSIVKDISSITHGHIRSVVACFYYLEFSRHIVKGTEKKRAYSILKHKVSDFLIAQSINPSEIRLFDRLLKGNIYELSEDLIYSSGYVLDTLEASIWCVLTTTSYADAVLKAVNLGRDTDTTAAVTGGLAGLLYGWESIPNEWMDKLARKDDIHNLSNRMKDFASR